MGAHKRGRHNNGVQVGKLDSRPGEATAGVSAGRAANHVSRVGRRPATRAFVTLVVKLQRMVTYPKNYLFHEDKVMKKPGKCASGFVRKKVDFCISL